jgi:hypothetical protein
MKCRDCGKKGNRGKQNILKNKDHHTGGCIYVEYPVCLSIPVEPAAVFPEFPGHCGLPDRAGLKTGSIRSCRALKFFTEN